MKHMKKVQSFDKFKREVRNLVKNHYKAKIAEKVQLKVSHKMQAKEEELQKVTKYAKKAEKHIVFCCALYHEQMRRGDYFLHEHPAGASSWRLPCMFRLMSALGVRRVIGHMCAHGMWQVRTYGVRATRTRVEGCPTTVGLGGQAC